MAGGSEKCIGFNESAKYKYDKQLYKWKINNISCLTPLSILFGPVLPIMGATAKAQAWILRTHNGTLLTGGQIRCISHCRDYLRPTFLKFSLLDSEEKILKYKTFTYDNEHLEKNVEGITIMGKGFLIILDYEEPKVLMEDSLGISWEIFKMPGPFN